MKHYCLFILTLALSSISFFSKGQGCSDAGVCSVGALNVLSFEFELLPSEKTKLAVVPVEDGELTNLRIKRKPQDSSKTVAGALTQTNSTDSFQACSYSKYTFLLNGSYASGEQDASVYTTLIDGG